MRKPLYPGNSNCDIRQYTISQRESLNLSALKLWSTELFSGVCSRSAEVLTHTKLRYTGQIVQRVSYLVNISQNKWLTCHSPTSEPTQHFTSQRTSSYFHKNKFPMYRFAGVVVVINHRKLSRKTQWAYYKSTREMLRLTWRLVKPIAAQRSWWSFAVESSSELGVFFLKGTAWRNMKSRSAMRWMTPGETASHTPNDAHLINKDILLLWIPQRRHLENLNEEQT